MTKDIYIKLTEPQANTLLKVVESHPNPGVWGGVSRNQVTAEIRSALSAGVRGDNSGAVSEDALSDEFVRKTFDNSDFETPEGDEAADGQIEESSEPEVVEDETPEEPESDVETEEKSEDELLEEMIAEEEAAQDEDDEVKDSDADDR